MTYLLDVSILLALLWETHEFNERVTRWQENQSLAVRCVAETEAKRLLELLQKYQDQQMDFADACLVRMSELERDAVVFTIDRSDFRVYRRNGNEPVPCVFPGEI
jgi:predicted nucleic acid-binding protein